MNDVRTWNLIYLNALNCIPLLGPKRITALTAHFGSARTAWEAPAEQFKQVAELTAPWQEIERMRAGIDPLRQWELLKKEQINCLALDDPPYPRLLKQISLPPPLIYFRGDLKKIDQPAVAIVGSRRCTFYGKEVAFRLSAELAGAGVGVISGMALGVDTAAHRGALDNSGYTVAVLGCGLDHCYPPSNRNLMDELFARGAVVSEFPPGTAPLPINFPRRNRIISALSLGTVVVEATAKSGALITASCALDQNREVFAVPGNVGSPYSRGCHRLLKEGARLVESAADILEELSLDSFGGEQMTIDGISCALSEEEKDLLERIPYQPLHIDDIVRLSDAGPARISTLLLELELKKKIRQTPGKFFCRI